MKNEKGTKIIDVLGIKYKVRFVNEIKGGKNGLTEFYKREIRIKIRASEIAVNYILRQELLHAFIFESGRKEMALNEAFVDTMTILFSRITSAINELDAMH